MKKTANCYTCDNAKQLHPKKGASLIYINSKVHPMLS